MIKKFEFSKMVMLGVSFVCLAIVIFSCHMIWKTSDLSPLAYLIPALAAAFSTAAGFYYNKAKAENKIKLMVANDIKPNEETIGKLYE